MTSPILLTEQRENEIEVQQQEEGVWGEVEDQEEKEEEKGGVVVQQINFISGLSTLLKRKKAEDNKRG